MNYIFNKFFPLKCRNCGEIGEIICDNCLYNCEILNIQYCIICDKPSLNGFTHKKCFLKNNIKITQNISMFNYKDLIRDSIVTSKFGSKRFLVLKKLSYEASYLLNEFNYAFKDHIIIPVPISKNRNNYRGFNQSYVISNILSKKLCLKVDKSIVERKRDTKHQYKLSKYNRKTNLSNSFFINKNTNLKGLKFLIVDDIITTGSTLKEISKVLYKANAKEVRCFTLSKMFKQKY